MFLELGISRRHDMEWLICLAMLPWAIFCFYIVFVVCNK